MDELEGYWFLHIHIRQQGTSAYTWGELLSFLVWRNQFSHYSVQYALKHITQASDIWTVLFTATTNHYTIFIRFTTSIRHQGTGQITQAGKYEETLQQTFYQCKYTIFPYILPSLSLRMTVQCSRQGVVIIIDWETRRIPHWHITNSLFAYYRTEGRDISCLSEDGGGTDREDLFMVDGFSE